MLGKLPTGPGDDFIVTQFESTELIDQAALLSWNNLKIKKIIEGDSYQQRDWLVQTKNT